MSVGGRSGQVSHGAQVHVLGCLRNHRKDTGPGTPCRSGESSRRRAWRGTPAGRGLGTKSESKTYAVGVRSVTVVGTRRGTAAVPQVGSDSALDQGAAAKGAGRFLDLFWKQRWR